MKTDDIIRQAQDRVPREFIRELTSLTDLSQQDLAWLIGFRGRTIHKTAKRDFSILISEHLLLLRSVFQLGLEVFDQNKKVFTQWLKTPRPELAFGQPAPSPSNTSLSSSEQTTLNPTPDQPAKAESAEVQLPSAQSQPTPVPLVFPTPFSLLDSNTGIGLVADLLMRRKSNQTDH
ncbi:antitoxin Xre-like helix-turn-helix domain-containing protein [Spirosoma jeollabukense]